MLHISTDYVFDGSKQGAYVEDDPVAPLGIYGESKAEGEADCAEMLEQHIILRTSWVFSATGNNFVKTMLRLGREREELGIVNDQHGCPTSARSIAEVLLKIADQYLRGATMSSGAPITTVISPRPPGLNLPRRFSDRPANYENLKLKAITTSDYPTPAARPKNSVLDCTKLEQAFGIRGNSWSEELRRVI